MTAAYVNSTSSPVVARICDTRLCEYGIRLVHTKGHGQGDGAARVGGRRKSNMSGDVVINTLQHSKSRGIVGKQPTDEQHF